MFHAGCRELPAKTKSARSVNEICYLPAYSPDFNPIEMAFSKLKALLRQAAARHWTELLEAVARALETFSPDQCLNFLRHAQYATD